MPVFSKPFPKLSWGITNGELVNSDLTKAVFSEPFPKASWQIINGEITTGLLPDIELVGAFANAVNLVKIVIPKSVKLIGDTAFRNTALSSVKISSDCVYSQESFPDGCNVDFY